MRLQDDEFGIFPINFQVSKLSNGGLPFRGGYAWGDFTKFGGALQLLHMRLGGEGVAGWLGMLNDGGVDRWFFHVSPGQDGEMPRSESEF